MTRAADRSPLITNLTIAHHFLALISIDRQASRAAIQSGCEVLAKITQKARDDAECEQLFAYMRASSVTVEQLIDKLQDEGAQVLQINVVNYADTPMD
jgi:hypothetical protein